jgi:hypothetical protein
MYYSLYNKHVGCSQYQSIYELFMPPANLAIHAYESTDSVNSVWFLVKNWKQEDRLWGLAGENRSGMKFILAEFLISEGYELASQLNILEFLWLYTYSIQLWDTLWNYSHCGHCMCCLRDWFFFFTAPKMRQDDHGIVAPKMQDI